MAFNAYQTVTPSYMVPEILVQQSQKSGAFSILPTKNQSIRLSEGDLFVYIKTLQARTHQDAGQSATELLNGPSFITELKQTPTYLMRLRYEYNHHDSNAASRWGMSLPDLYRKASWQTFAQNERNALLYGFQPANGEGILNAPGITNVNLPPDTNGDTTFVTYDNGQMGFFIMQQVTALRTRMFLGGQTGGRICILGPQRELAFMETVNIVQLTQFQRNGAGVETTGGMVSDVFGRVGITVEWLYDDTLIGQGANGTDAIVIVAPELAEQDVESAIDTNAFGRVIPNNRNNLDMFADMGAPREMTVPLPGGAVDTTAEKRITSGWGVRPEAITVLSMQYQ